MSDKWTERLSEYLDDELTPGECEALESHLATCPDCARTLTELRRVVASAQALRARPPVNDLWADVASRTVSQTPEAERQNVMPFDAAQGRPSRQAQPQPRRISFTLPQLAAAAMLLAAVSSGIAFQFRPGVDPAVQGPAAALQDDPAGAVVPVSLADQEYDAAVSDLEKTLDEGRALLDPATIAIVEQNLAIINVAIEQARQALEADPANGYLSSYLVQARRKKLDLLRRAAAMTAESAQS